MKYNFKVGDLVTIKGSANRPPLDQGDVGIVIFMKARGAMWGCIPFIETTVAWSGERGTGRYWSSDLEVIA